MKTPDEIKKGLVEAIEEASWVVEGGDAHDLIDAVEKAHASMADALACIQQLEYENKDLLEERELNEHLRDKVKQLETAHRTEYCEEADYDCKALGEARKRIAELEAQAPKWISVEERLPDDHKRVLIAVQFENGISIHTTGFSGGAWYVTLLDSEYVTHWMPLPEPPKEG